MGAAGERHDRLTRGQGKVRAGGVVPACRQDIHEWREHEENPGEGCDTAGRVADDRADGKAEETDGGQVERGAEHGACDARVTECDVDVVPGEDRLAHPERDQGGRCREREDDEAVDHHLGPQDR